MKEKNTCALPNIWSATVKKLELQLYIHLKKLVTQHEWMRPLKMEFPHFWFPLGPLQAIWRRAFTQFGMHETISFAPDTGKHQKSCSQTWSTLSLTLEDLGARNGWEYFIMLENDLNLKRSVECCLAVSRTKRIKWWSSMTKLVMYPHIVWLGKMSFPCGSKSIFLVHLGQRWLRIISKGALSVSQIWKIVTTKIPLYKDILKWTAATILINTPNQSDDTICQTMREIAVKMRKLRHITKTEISRIG